MTEKRKVTKTEIFCLLLTAAFLVLTAVLYAGGPRTDGGVQVTVWKNVDVSDKLPQKVNINTADEAQLQLLPGIGPVLAQRIVAWRQTNGDFAIAEDLLAVEGIGLTKLEEIRDLIMIQEEP